MLDAGSCGAIRQRWVICWIPKMTSFVSGWKWACTPKSLPKAGGVRSIISDQGALVAVPPERS
jgi:hypothetical protein